jgi:hypothetical protein
MHWEIFAAGFGLGAIVIIAFAARPYSPTPRSDTPEKLARREFYRRIYERSPNP